MSLKKQDGTFLASLTSECRTAAKFLSSGDSSRKSNTRSMTTCFSGGAGRGSSSISAVWSGVKRWRTSSCTRKTTEKRRLTTSTGFSSDGGSSGCLDLLQRSLSGACRSRWRRQILRRNQSCLSASLHCDWLRTHSRDLKHANLM